jgi:phage replication O-like protein O
MRITTPNYTQTPNDLFDHWLPLLKEVELKVLLVIMRKTFGWHKTRDYISLSQLEQLTGCSQTNILKSIKTLIEKGLISKEVVGKIGSQTTYYQLIVNEDSNNSYPSQIIRGTPNNLGGGTPDNLSGTKENDKKERLKKDDIVGKQKRNSLEDLDYRSSSLQDSIVSFDFTIYKFPDGTSISPRMQNGFKKYTQEQFDKLQATIFYFEADISRGKKPKTSYEQMLQGYINGKYAEKAEMSEKNRFYATFLKAEHKTCNIKILKTVVQFRKSSDHLWESLDLDLEPTTFANILEACAKNQK